MNVEAFLWSYRDAKLRLDQLQIKKRKLYESCMDTSGLELATIDGERHVIPKSGGGSGRSSRVENLAIELATIDEEIAKEIEDKAKTLITVTSVIDRIRAKNPLMTEVYKKELYLHYIDGLTWEETSVAVGYTDASIYKHREKMLDCVRRVIENATL